MCSPPDDEVSICPAWPCTVLPILLPGNRTLLCWLQTGSFAKRAALSLASFSQSCLRLRLCRLASLSGAAAGHYLAAGQALANWLTTATSGMQRSCCVSLLASPAWSQNTLKNTLPSCHLLLSGCCMSQRRPARCAPLRAVLERKH